MIIGISGKAGTGKDTASNYLVQKHGFVQIALADPIKRFAIEILDFSEEQLWGESDQRNKPDERYPTDNGFLVPRKFLQNIGTEGARNVYKDIWIQYTIKVAKKIESGEYCYDKIIGPYKNLANNKPQNVIISDARYFNEINSIKEHGIVIRIKRNNAVRPGLYLHTSEVEQDSIPDSEFDYVLNNNSTKEKLYKAIDSIIEAYF